MRVVRQEERDLEGHVEQAGIGGGAFEGGAPSLRLEVKVGAQVREPERTQARGIGVGEDVELPAREADLRKRQLGPAEGHHHRLGAVALVGKRTGHGGGGLLHGLRGDPEE